MDKKEMLSKQNVNDENVTETQNSITVEETVSAPAQKTKGIKKQKKIIIFSAIAAIIIGFSILTYLVIIPPSFYKIGTKAFDNSDYSKASFFLRKTRNYNNSEIMANYAAGKVFFENEDYVSCANTLKPITPYLDSDSIISKCALALFNEKKYEDAITVFKDSKIIDKKRYINYSRAKLEISNKNYMAAISYLDKAEGLLDSDELGNQCNLQLATDFYNKKDYINAAEYYAKCTITNEIKNKALTCFYAAAESSMASKSYGKAEKYYSLCKGYKDSDTKLNESKYLSACEDIKSETFYYTVIEDFKELGNYRKSKEGLLWAQIANEKLDYTDVARSELKSRLKNPYSYSEIKTSNYSSANVSDDGVVTVKNSATIYYRAANSFNALITDSFYSSSFPKKFNEDHIVSAKTAKEIYNLTADEMYKRLIAE